MAESRQLSEGIFLAAASALCYGVAFAYQSGYASYFGIPPLLLTPTIGTVLKAAGVVGLAFLSFWNIANGIWIYSPHGDSALYRGIRRLITIALIVGLIVFNVVDGWTAWITFASVMSFVAFSEFIFPLITNRKITGYENKLIAQEEIERNVQKHMLIEKVAREFGEGSLRLALAALLIIMLAHITGNKTARNQEDFYVASDQSNSVVLHMENNILILGAYDPISMTLSGRYIVEQLSDSRRWSLERKRVGRLSGPTALQSLEKK